MDVGSRIDTSIIMTHYSENNARTEMALKCILAIQPYRNETTEFILCCNGHYPELKIYCDQYFDRDADASPGKSSNIGAKAAYGNILVFMCDDILVFGNWLDECKTILERYPKYLATPAYQSKRRWHELSMVDGYCVNKRVGSDIMVMTREQYNDIGKFDEVNPMYDGSNYINRRLKKGYAVMMTKEPLATNLSPNIHSYIKQQEQMKYEYAKDYRDKKWE
jgi:hypothetical protein